MSDSAGVGKRCTPSIAGFAFITAAAVGGLGSGYVARSARMSDR